jgi:hypothetical protein
MSPSQLIRFSTAQLDGLTRISKRGGGGGRRVERAIALAVVAAAIVMPLVLVLMGVHPLSPTH